MLIYIYKKRRMIAHSPLIHNYAMTLASTNVRHYKLAYKLYFAFNFFLTLI